MHYCIQIKNEFLKLLKRNKCPLLVFQCQCSYWTQLNSFHPTLLKDDTPPVIVPEKAFGPTGRNERETDRPSHSVDRWDWYSEFLPSGVCHAHGADNWMWNTSHRELKEHSQDQFWACFTKWLMTKLGSGVMKTTDVAGDLRDIRPAGRGPSGESASVHREINSEDKEMTEAHCDTRSRFREIY